MPKDTQISPSARRLSCGAAILLAMTASAAMAARADTPKGRYDIDLVCAARTQTGLPVQNEPADKVKILADLYAKRIAGSGRAIGKTPPQIAQDVASTRADMLRTAARGGSNRAEVLKLGEYCGALPVFEIIDRAKGKPN